jgi:outer membrane protein insertion porin family
MSVGGRYSLTRDKISLNKNTFFEDLDGDGDVECSPRLAGRYLCDEIGRKTTSLIGYSVIFDSTDGIRPTRGRTWVFSQDFAGLGGDVKYLRSRIDATQYKSLGGGWVFSVHGEGGYISALGSTRHDSLGNEIEPIRLTDRFFGPQLRGFDIRGIGPRIQRVPYVCNNTSTCNAPTLDPTQARITDALGGTAYYMGRLELEFPISSTLKSLGLRPSAFVDVGSLWKIRPPQLTDIPGVCSAVASTTTPQVITLNPGESCPATGYTASGGFKEFFLGDSWRPRVSIGVGVNWTSPFGPLRIDVAKALVKQDGDDTKLFSFNVGTQF